MLSKMRKIHRLRNKSNGSYLFFDENEDMIYYSLVLRTGETLRAGNMEISKENSIDYMQKNGFEYLKARGLI